MFASFRKMFEDLVKDKLLFARVIWRYSIVTPQCLKDHLLILLYRNSTNGILCVELHDLHSTGVSLNETVLGRTEKLVTESRPKEKGKKRLEVPILPG